ncbi:hypothetical protein ACQ4PT_043585 [Festuca glaucescens]
MDHGGKKPRLQLPNLTLNEQVKKESNQDEQEPTKAIVVAAAAAPVVKLVIEFDKPLLDCPLCCLPLKPPVFQCRAKHAACGNCAASRSNKCASCVDGGGVYEHIHWLDPYVLAAKVRCPNEAYGCRSSVPYCMAVDHQLVCAHAPCCCPEPGCIFSGSPPTLRDHLASHHRWVVTPISCGKCIVVEMQPAERRRLLAAEEGDNVFLVVASERGGALRWCASGRARRKGRRGTGARCGRTHPWTRRRDARMS